METAEAWHKRSDPRVGHLVGPERPLLRAGGRIGCAVELADDRAHRRNGEYVLRYRQHAPDDHRDLAAS